MIRNIISSVGLAFVAIMAVSGLYVVIEPAMSFGASTQFTVSQVVTSEVSFLTPGTNITLAPSLGGVTGGDATGVLQVVVLTNNSTGYNMTLTASSSGTMVGQANPSNNIPAYTPQTPSVPDYNFTAPVNTARFGYTVSASTTGDLAQAFKTDGIACNTGSGDPALSHCWLNASGSAVQIINRVTPTDLSGSTSTLAFHVKIMSNPNPMIPNDTYTATTTLTASVNP
jgi:hypothetical protein